MSKDDQYFSNVIQLLQTVHSTQQEPIQKAAEAIYTSLARGGTVFAFGTGHSHMLAEELFYRAGGLVKVYPLLDEPLMLHINASRSSHLERLPGYAHTLLEKQIAPGGHRPRTINCWQKVPLGSFPQSSKAGSPMESATILSFSVRFSFRMAISILSTAFFIPIEYM